MSNHKLELIIDALRLEQEHIPSFREISNQIPKDNLYEATGNFFRIIPFEEVMWGEETIRQNLPENVELLTTYPSNNLNLKYGREKGPLRLVMGVVKSGSDYKHILVPKSMADAEMLRIESRRKGGIHLEDQLAPNIYTIAKPIQRTNEGLILGKLIGVGGQGRVINAYHEESNTHFAIKVVNNNNPDLWAALETEAQALNHNKGPGVSQLLYPGLVHFEDHEDLTEILWAGKNRRDGLREDDPLIALLTRYRQLSGRDILKLHQRLYREEFKKEGKSDWLDQCLGRFLYGSQQALAGVNSFGDEHGDMKIENIIGSLIPVVLPGRGVGYQIGVEVMDFGIAMSREQRDARDVFMGTPSAVEPEIFYPYTGALTVNESLKEGIKYARYDYDVLRDPFMTGIMALSIISNTTDIDLNQVKEENVELERILKVIEERDKKEKKTPKSDQETTVGAGDEVVAGLTTEQIEEWAGTVRWDDEGYLRVGLKRYERLRRENIRTNEGGKLTTDEIAVAMADGIRIEKRDLGRIGFTIERDRSYIKLLNKVVLNNQENALGEINKKQEATKRFARRATEHKGNYSSTTGFLTLIDELTAMRVHRRNFDEFTIAQNGVGLVWKPKKRDVGCDSDQGQLYKLSIEDSENPNKELAEDLIKIFQAIDEAGEEGFVFDTIDYARNRRGLSAYLNDERIQYVQAKKGQIPLANKDGSITYVKPNGNKSIEGHLYLGRTITHSAAGRLKPITSEGKSNAFLGLETIDPEQLTPIATSYILAAYASDPTVAETYIDGARREKEQTGDRKEVFKSAMYAIAERLGVADQMYEENAILRKEFNNYGRKIMFGIEYNVDIGKDLIVRLLEMEQNNYGVIERANQEKGEVFSPDLLGLIKRGIEPRLTRDLSAIEIDLELKKIAIDYTF